jgi:hypothetical protein
MLLPIAVLALLASGAAEKTPVLLELFTSLGCSSCPPADKLLVEIDRQQPIAAARLIVLSEHVDYWDNPQWSDPFSSAAYTARQQSYDSRFGVEVYTPQLVVDGSKAVLGSDWGKAANAIKQSLSSAKIAMHVTATRAEGKAQLEIDAGPNSSGKKAVVILVLAHDRADSHVGGGENAGRESTEAAVAYSLREAGKIEPGSTFQKSLSVSLPAKSTAGDSRAIVFVRRADTMQVIGADQIVF